MKRTLTLIFTILIILCLCGCDKDNNDSIKTPVKINLPKDNTVNGYKNENSASDDKTASKITTENIQINENVKAYSYWGNKNSKKFHKANCSSFKNTKEENIVFFNTRNEFVSYGYNPCKICKP